MIRADVDAVVRAHRTLLDRLSGDDRACLCDDHISRPSNLTGWTVGHVLAHLAANAESMVRLSIAARSGLVGRQYPGGASERAANIERDSRLSATVLVERLRDSIIRLDDLWALAEPSSERMWSGRSELVSGAVVPVTGLPLRRWREVEVHMGDLGIVELGCDGPNAWSPEYIRRDVRVLTMQWTSRGSMGMNTLPAAIASLDDRERLVWLLGRRQVEGIDPAGLL